MSDPILERVRALCLALPEVVERVSHGEPAWFAGRGRQFVTYADHHHDDRLALWAAAPEGAQAAWVASDAERYVVPPYVGGRGWVGVVLDLDGGPDWDALADIVEDAYRCVANQRQLRALDA